jgi:topoisomerase-4 subunit A
VYWFTVNPNGETDKVIVNLRKVSGIRKYEIDLDFAELPVKARSAVGNIVTKYAVNKVILKEKGASTLDAEDFWFDETTHRLNKEERGTYLGKFSGDDKILAITSKGVYKLYTYDLLNHFDEDIILIEKYYPTQMLTCIYFDGESRSYFTKRFLPESTSTKTSIITENENSIVELITNQVNPIVDVKFAKEKGKDLPDETIKMVEFAPEVNMKAKGKKLTSYKVKEINLREPEEIKAAKKFLSTNQDEKTGLSPMELHRRAMEKLNKDNAKDFLDGDGQITFEF